MACILSATRVTDAVAGVGFGTIDIVTGEEVAPRLVAVMSACVIASGIACRTSNDGRNNKSNRPFSSVNWTGVGGCKKAFGTAKETT
jgi:hypothetical protein